MNAAAPNTICRLTPPGKAAIATLAIQGDAVFAALQELFRRRSGKATSFQAGDVLFGKLGAAEKQADDVVLAILQCTPYPRAEIHCHGGNEVVRYLEGLFQERGFQVVSWQDAAGQDADLLHLLTHAPTVRTASILLDQMSGASARFIARLNDASPLAEKAALCRRYLGFERLGRHLVEPWRVVIAGAPNVGKSSLINAISGYERSIVSHIPGTTRDVVTATVAIDGWPVELFDTAGLRSGGDALETAGHQRAEQAAREADLLVHVVETAAAPTWPPPGDVPLLRVINKIDLAPAWDLSSAPESLRVSAHTGQGIADLLERISAMLVPAVPAPGEAVPIRQGDVIQARALVAS